MPKLLKYSQHANSKILPNANITMQHMKLLKNGSRLAKIQFTVKPEKA